jgi:hypothetical protein
MKRPCLSNANKKTIMCFSNRRVSPQVRIFR